MAYVQITRLMATGTGRTIDLGQDCAKVTITTKGDVYVRVDPPGDSPTPPAADPAPAASASASYIHLAASGDKLDVGADADGKGLVPGLQDPIRFLRYWSKSDADLLIVGH